MNTLSEQFNNECCGTLCDKNDMANKLRTLEEHNIALQSEIDEYNTLRANKESFARKVFMAGLLAGTERAASPERAWQQYRVECLR